MVRALHRHRNDVRQIPAGGPIVDDFFLTAPRLEFRLVMTRAISSLDLARLLFTKWPRSRAVISVIFHGFRAIGLIIERIVLY